MVFMITQLWGKSDLSKLLNSACVVRCCTPPAYLGAREGGGEGRGRGREGSGGGGERGEGEGEGEGGGRERGEGGGP